MPELKLPDVTLHYELSGKAGTPLLMIGGLMSDSSLWTPLLPLLEPDFRLIRPDNRTCGRTRPWDAPVSMTHWRDDAIRILDALEIDKTHVLGHSLGGIIGWALAAHAPDRVASLLMLGSAPIFTPRNVSIYASLIATRRSNAPEDTWLRALFPWTYGERAFHDLEAMEARLQATLAYPHTQTTDGFELQLATLPKTDPTPFMKPPPVPCKSVLSRDDLLVPFEDAKGILGAFPTEEIQGLGHAMHWDDPATIAQMQKNFAAAHPMAELV